MSTDPHETPRPLPDRPNLRHLKDQAKDLLASGGATTLGAAQFQIARLYGFASWPRLKAHVDSTEEWWQLFQAINADDVERVKTLMTRNPALHRAPLGYHKNGPLTWVAECRMPGGPPSAARLAIAQWMIEHGSDVHQGGDGPLMRAALDGQRVAMMALLVSRGADVNAAWNGSFPIIFAPCETVDPVALAWLLEHGANPNGSGQDPHGVDTALDYLIGSYGRSSRLSAWPPEIVGGNVARRVDATHLVEHLVEHAARMGRAASLGVGEAQRQHILRGSPAEGVRLFEGGDRLRLPPLGLVHEAKDVRGIGIVGIARDRLSGVFEGIARSAGKQLEMRPRRGNQRRERVGLPCSLQLRERVSHATIVVENQLYCTNASGGGVSSVSARAKALAAVARLPSARSASASAAWACGSCGSLASARLASSAAWP